ncbi:MAG: YrdB family protein [Chitinophagales bacterium]
MSAQQFNLYLRLILKILALFAMAYWAWQVDVEYIPAVLRVFTVLIIALIVWGAFTVSYDPFKTAKPVFSIGGVARIFIELFYFGFAIFCLYDSGLFRWSWVYSNLVLLHFAFSHQRMATLLKGTKK